MPWANVVEGIGNEGTTSIMDEMPKLDKILKEEGLLPERTLACRFCNERIEVDTDQCPHCLEWLAGTGHAFNLDPWAGGRHAKSRVPDDAQRLNMGCFAIVLMLFVLGLFLLKV